MGWPGPMTHRQFRAWRAWLDLQWNRPSRTDHYIMQATMEGLRPHVKKGTKLSLKEFRIPFGTPQEKAAERVQDPEENRAAWLAMMPLLGPGAKYTPGPAPPDGVMTEG